MFAAFNGKAMVVKKKVSFHNMADKKLRDLLLCLWNEVHIILNCLIKSKAYMSWAFI